jgi:hypothetical protein
MGFNATPESIAAFGTAGATTAINLDRMAAHAI